MLLEASVLLRLLVPMPRMPAAPMEMVLGAQARNDYKSQGNAEAMNKIRFPAHGIHVPSFLTAKQTPDTRQVDSASKLLFGPALHSGTVCMPARPSRTLLAISRQEGSVAGTVEGQAKV